MARRRRKSLSENILKGRIFEFVISKLLEKAGFILNVDSDQLTKNKKKRLKGRGSTYDPDFLGEFPITIPFSYPLLLVGEAKYHNKTLKVDDIRHFLGAFLDVSQFARIDTKSKAFKYSQIFFNKRHNYIPVIFSRSGFQRNAQALMWTHGIYFVSYENSAILEDICKKIDILLTKIDFKSLTKEDLKKITSLEKLKEIRYSLKKENYDSVYDKLIKTFSPTKSYFGILDGMWPVHVLTKNKANLRPTLKIKKCSCIENNNQIIIKKSTNKNSTNLGFFALPDYFLKEYRKISEKKNKKILYDLTLYVPQKNKIFPYYIELQELSNNKQEKELTTNGI
ncbi:MAG: hypothetical protein WC867_04995 [Candidatus Pacearchaeota archaeon]|jgi:hypothetical protein